MAERVRPGVEVLLDEGLPGIEGRRVGLLTNHTGVDSRLRSTADLLAADPRFRLAALFGPEHGVRGDAPDGAAVASGRDPATGLPVHSLYGAVRRPTPEMLAGIEALIFDIQDIGARYYTYVWTMAGALAAAAERGIPFVVLDRPNPITARVEGNLPEAGYLSFVGLHPVAMRHGLTVGEMARLLNAEYVPEVAGRPAEVHVVPVRGWRGGRWFDETGLSWVPTSPSAPGLGMALVYPGTCLFEGTNLAEGRGTANPFELVGAPWVDARRWVDALAARCLPGVLFRPAHFRPAAAKHAGVPCAGVQVHVTGREAFRPVATALHMLETVRALHPREFGWRPAPAGEHPFVDLLAGGDGLRRAVDAGRPAADLAAEWDEQAREFARRARPYRMYPP